MTRSRIGVSIQQVNAQLAESFGLDRPRGALVGMVEDDGPGAKAGIKAGDVILKVDGKDVERPPQLPGIISCKKPGNAVNLEVWRDGGTKRSPPRSRKSRKSRRGSRSATAKSRTRPPSSASRCGRWRGGAQEAETDGDLVVEDVNGPAARPACNVAISSSA